MVADRSIRHSPRSRPAALPPRRGVTAVLAMMYLILFSTLAVGFYASVNTGVQVVGNDRRNAKALLAAESGMEYMKYQLATVQIDKDQSDPAAVMATLYEQLKAHVEDTAPVGVNRTVWLSPDGMVIKIPAAGRVALDQTSDGPGFTATLNAVPDGKGKVTVAVSGAYGNTTTVGRTVSMDFKRKEIPAKVWNFAVASAGQIHLSKGSIASAIGTVLEDRKISAMSAVDPSNTALAGQAVHVDGGTLGGNLTVLDGAGIWFVGGSVGGHTNAAAVNSELQYMTTPPVFPDVDTSVYANLTKTVWPQTVAKNTYRNCKVPAGASGGGSIKFTGSDKIEGILYVESPNQIEFSGDCTINGYIVFQRNDAATNDKITLTGNLSQDAVPPGKEFDSVRVNSNIAILAPTADVTLTGSSGNQNKPSVLLGSVIVDTFHMKGASGLTISHGSIVTLNEGADSALFETSKSLKFDGTAADNAPTNGIQFAENFAPQAFTYREWSENVGQ